MFLSRMVSLVLVMAALASAGTFWTKPPTKSKDDRSGISTAVQHSSFAVPAHARTLER
jgi:hypothetical protein